MLSIYISYIILLIIILYLLFRVYLKIYHPFWSIQPVYHFYDLHYILYDPCIINVNLPIEDLKVFKKDDYVDIQFPKESAQVID